MAKFLIALDDGEVISYETDGATMLRGDGSKIDLSRFAYRYVDGAPIEKQIAFSKDNPVVGKDSPRILKIQLGLGCNYSCTYCSQGGQVEEATSSGDAEAFSLEWANGTPDKVELWGGEPLLYWKKIQALVVKIQAKWPGIRMSMVSNGTLLTKERIDWLHASGFSMALSHDGPGQHIRGADPLEDMEMRKLWQYFFHVFGERASINAVLTSGNHDLFALWMWFEERLGTVKINVEDIVTDYGGAKMSESQLLAVYQSVKKHTSSGLAMVFPRIKWAMLQFMETLAIAKPFVGGGQVCGMDRKDQIAVDLNGNVLTCQNAGAESGHIIGNVSDIGAASLNTSTSYMNRPNCAECPVVHLCYGSCMFLEGDNFESSCRASYHYNRAVMDGAVKLLTGKDVVSVSGWKPSTAKRVIPIKVTA